MTAPEDQSSGPAEPGEPAAPAAPREPREPREKDSLESVGLGPRKMALLILLVIAGAFVYFVLLGGEART